MWNAVFQALSGVLKENELIVRAGNASFLRDKSLTDRYSAGKSAAPAPEPFEKNRQFDYVSSITEEIEQLERQLEYYRKQI